jgi:hypothetical protein
VPVLPWLHYKYTRREDFVVHVLQANKSYWPFPPLTLNPCTRTLVCTHAVGDHLSFSFSQLSPSDFPNLARIVRHYTPCEQANFNYSAFNHGNLCSHMYVVLPYSACTVVPSSYLTFCPLYYAPNGARTAIRLITCAAPIAEDHYRGLVTLLLHTLHRDPRITPRFPFGGHRTSFFPRPTHCSWRIL